MTFELKTRRRPTCALGTGRRGDIQGLRALAVVLVVIQHTLGFPVGGFIGVDIFFVISGFLISQILLRELDSRGRINLVAFYARRIRRIVPGAILVAIVATCVAYLLWFRPRADQTLLDGIASTLWVSNWHFAATGTDYLAGSASPSPFQHYWSLSVEEQFYVFWPWCLLGLTALGARWRRGRSMLLVGLMTVAIAGFVWAILFTAFQPRLAYFDLASRSWEFAVGAIAAMILGSGRVPDAIRRWATLFGLGLILVAALLVSEHAPFPGPWAAVPVLGAVFILLGKDTSHGAFMLTNATMRYLGDISYSLYLWHFPVVVFAASLAGGMGWAIGIAALPLMLLLSVASYHWVENPIRTSAWLRSWERPRITRDKHSFAFGTALVVVVLALAAFQFNPPRAYVMADRTMPVERTSATVAFETQAEISAAIRSGAEGKVDGGPIPSFDELVPRQLAEAMSQCSNDVSARPLSACESKGGPLKVAVMGDSVAMSWVPLLERAFPGGTSFLEIGVASCSPWTLVHRARFPSQGFVRDCSEARQLQFERIRSWAPNVVVVSSAAGAFSLQEGDQTGVPGWAAGVATTVTVLKASADRVIVLGSPPIGADPRACLNKLGGAARCLAERQQLDVDKVQAERVGALSARAEYVDVTRWFCTDDGSCPATIGPYVVRTDATHITAAMAQSLAPLMKASLEAPRG